MLIRFFLLLMLSAPAWAVSYVQIATELQTVLLPTTNPTTVYFGDAASNRLVSGSFTGSVTCNSSSFGGVDPAYGTSKFCYIDGGSSSAPPSSGWDGYPIQMVVFVVSLFFAFSGGFRIGLAL